MKTALAKTAAIAILVLIPVLALANWKTYLMDKEYPDVFNEFDVTVTNNGSTTTLTTEYSHHSYWRQVAPKYEISNWLPTPSTLPPLTFTNMSVANLTSALPFKVPGFMNSSTVTHTNTVVNNVTVVGNSSSSGTNSNVVLPGSSAVGGVIVVPPAK